MKIHVFLSLGINPHPSIIVLLHMSGVIMNVYPLFLNVSMAQLVNANSNIAA